MAGRLLPAGLLILTAACARGGAETARAPSEAPWRKPGDKIDSILPMPEYLRRFRAGLDAPTRLTGGGATRDELARRFLRAVSRQDTAALIRLLISRAEFAWLVFPDHLYSRPPYELDPAVFWWQLGAESSKGFARTVQRYGGRPLAMLGVTCRRDTLQAGRGPLELWSPCVLRYRAGDSVVTRRLFGSMVARDGRVKLLSLASEF